MIKSNVRLVPSNIVFNQYVYLHYTITVSAVILHHLITSRLVHWGCWWLDGSSNSTKMSDSDETKIWSRAQQFRTDHQLTNITLSRFNPFETKTILPTLWRVRDYAALCSAVDDVVTLQMMWNLGFSLRTSICHGVPLSISVAMYIYSSDGKQWTAWAHCAIPQCWQIIV